eukprot:1158008-Pelagomonas_calceolata.AAC.6
MGSVHTTASAAAAHSCSEGAHRQVHHPPIAVYPALHTFSPPTLSPPPPSHLRADVSALHVHHAGSCNVLQQAA